MTSTATRRLRLDKQETGTNPATWGIRLNHVEDLVDEAFGFVEIAVNGDYTLTANNYTSDEARRLILRFVGTGLQGPSPALVTIPAVDKPYFVDNRCGSDVLVGFPAGDRAVIRAGTAFWLYSDGVNVAKTTDLPLNLIASPTGDVSMAGFRMTGAADGVDPGDYVTVRQNSASGAAASAAAAASSASQAAASAAAAQTFNPANYFAKSERGQIVGLSYGPDALA